MPRLLRPLASVREARLPASAACAALLWVTAGCGGPAAARPEERAENRRVDRETFDDFAETLRADLERINEKLDIFSWGPRELRTADDAGEVPTPGEEAIRRLAEVTADPDEAPTFDRIKAWDRELRDARAALPPGAEVRVLPAANAAAWNLAAR